MQKAPFLGGAILGTLAILLGALSHGALIAFVKQYKAGSLEGQVATRCTSLAQTRYLRSLLGAKQ